MQVEDDIADPEQMGVIAAWCWPARQRIKAGGQLGEGEGLDQIVVGTALQPLDAIGDPADRGQHQDRGRIAGRAHRLHQRQPVEAGQHTVDHDRIEPAAGRLEQPVAAVLAHRDLVPGLAKPLRHEGAGVGIILDDQYPHRPTIA